MGHFERMSAGDATFLAVESSHAHMHVGAVAVLEGAPLARADGGLDMARVRDHLLGALTGYPRYRQRVIRTPVLRQPVWIDDAHFDIDYHLRHTRLPLPGDERQLKRLAGLVFSGPLDHSRPLWELWLVEGLAGGRVGLIAKVHHCMIDGIAGVSLLAAILRGTPDATVAPPPALAAPRPPPSRRELVRAELVHRVGAVAAAPRGVRAGGRPLRTAVVGAADLLRRGLVPADPGPFNARHVGPHRRFDTASLDLAAVKLIKNALGGTVNDVVLAVVTGALARSLRRHGVDPRSVHDFRALLPVNVRPDSARGALGNFVAMLLAPLPVDADGPAERYRRVAETTRWLKERAGHTEGSALLNRLADGAATTIAAGVFDVAIRLRAFNVVVTNVPGPPFPLWLLGARLLAIYPLVPLFETQRLGVAMLSYAGRVFVGLNADRDGPDDLHAIARDLDAELADLTALATTRPP